MRSRQSVIVVLLVVVGLTAPSRFAYATIIAQDLFDSISATEGASLGGQSYTATGFSGAWSSSSANVSLLSRHSGTDVLPGYGPPSQESGGSVGKIWSAASDNWGNIYSARALASGNQINLAQDGTYYFSFKGTRGADAAGFMGFSTGEASTDSFVSVGWTFSNAFPLSDPNGTGPMLHQTSYIGQGTLGSDRGAYGIRVAGANGSIPDGDSRFFVARITASATGNDRIDLKVYSATDTIDNNLDAIAWTDTYSFASDANLNNVILGSSGWRAGSELDAFRLGTTWSDVTGVMTIPEPGTSLLLATGLLGLLAYAWRKGR